MKKLLEVHGVDEVNYAVVELERRDVEVLLNKSGLMRNIKAGDVEAYCLDYWSSEAEFYLVRDDIEEVEEVTPDIAERVRVDAARLRVTYEEVRWLAYLKHAPEPREMETSAISFDELRELQASL